MKNVISKIAGVAILLGAVAPVTDAFIRTQAVNKTSRTSQRVVGETVVVTWGIVRDGTETSTAFVDDGVDNVSDFIARLDDAFNVPQSQRTSNLRNRIWQQEMEKGMDFISAKCGVELVYVDYDDNSTLGIELANAQIGVNNVRADIRVGGLALGGIGGYSASGITDIAAPVVMNSIDSRNHNAEGLRAIFIHEVMHSLGHSHCNVNRNRINTTLGLNAEGPQFDDYYSLQQSYGDLFEGATNNNVIGRSHNLGVLNAGGNISIGTDVQNGGTYRTNTSTANDIVSIGDDSDVDYFRFQINQRQRVNISVAARGPDPYTFSFNSPFSDVVGGASPRTNSNLSFRVFNSSNNQLQRVDNASFGGVDTYSAELDAGTYYVAVEGDLANLSNSDEFFGIIDLETDRAQFYSLEIEAEANVGPLVAHWKLDERNGTDVADSSGNGFTARSINTGSVDGVDGNVFTFNGSNSRVNLPATAFDSISDQITISMWVFGDSSQARNDTILHATDSAGNRVLNIHLPWGDSNVYWDAGNTGSSFDRASKSASSNQYEGQWNHWTFVKNTNVGAMVIYLNGEEFHTELGNTRSMSGITAATLGSALTRLYYDGAIDDVRLYNVGHGRNTVADIFAEYEINGVPVTWLTRFNLPLTVPSTLADTDGDGVNNREEFLAGSDPRVGNNVSPDIRVTEYALSSGDFTDVGASITLNQNLADDYFILVRGSRAGNGASMPDNDYARVTKVPGGRGDLTPLSGSNTNGRIILSRFVADFDWEGVVTVVECLNSDSAGGFKLVDVLSTELRGTSGTDTSANWSNINQVALFGGYRGGGASFQQAATDAEQGTSVYTRIFPSGTNRLNWARNAGGETLRNAVMTTFVVEWGSEWNVQRARVVGSAGGEGANASGEYISARIDSVVRDQTWVWGTGFRSDAGIGDCAESSLVTLGNGVRQTANENEVAVGSEYTDSSDFEVYVMSHPDLDVDYRFKSDGNVNETDVSVTVDTAPAGARFGWSYNGTNGTGSAFPRPRMWARYTTNSRVTVSRGYSGQNFPAWVQGIDFSGLNN